AKTTPIWCEGWQGNVYVATKNAADGINVNNTLVGVIAPEFDATNCPTDATKATFNFTVKNAGQVVEVVKIQNADRLLQALSAYFDRKDD
ncbi:MAG: hypothetical protein K2W88_01745, partial [Pararheinheimera sp.]|nr:hypothetical protein [Rheinheimera sp.]